MRKHNEGYALVLVLVVLLVLCILSSFMLTFSLRNLKQQEASANRLQAQYDAAGKIEIEMGRLQDFIKRIPQGTTVTAVAEPENSKVTFTTQDAVPVSLEVQGAAKLEGGKLNLILVSASETVQIDCVLQFAAVVSGDASHYSLTNLTGVEYVSYEISALEGGGTE